MVPTLSGRIQTRLFLLAIVGVPWTLIVSVIAPHNPGSLAHLYQVTFWVLAEVAVVGCLAFEPIYHVLMQFRWEKDWPIMFFLFEAIPEGVVAYFLLKQIGPSPTPAVATTATFLTQFPTVWFLVWLTAIGPMRVIVPRWRFRGGQVI